MRVSPVASLLARIPVALLTLIAWAAMAPAAFALESPPSAPRATPSYLYSPTDQSAPVQKALTLLCQDGHQGEFAALFDSRAGTFASSPQTRKRLCETFRARATGATYNIRSETQGHAQADTLMGLESHKLYGVEVLGGHQGMDPIWKITVHCSGIALLDLPGVPHPQSCRIGEIRAAEHGETALEPGAAQVGQGAALTPLDAQAQQAGARAKSLRDDVLATGMGAGSAAGAQVPARAR
jgi:hypothetical protein